ncbi:hypothetical protein C3B55_00612 [Candidatus Pseudomonas adelgestsugas]|uniref:Uncharacterized protein n=1 Tax=Candidatus Pseudomonas adelgestsugas TaxID=1302376 RepID=A0ABX5R8G0_9PSED|nr:hypothetical protein C3B55_00612 [Candidatus Pseudomonas adelgestsugas]
MPAVPSGYITYLAASNTTGNCTYSTAKLKSARFTRHPYKEVTSVLTSDIEATEDWIVKVSKRDQKIIFWQFHD